MASSGAGADEMPKERLRADVPTGVEVPLCWCQDPCRLMKSDEFSYTYGRRFFMCANYDEDPPKFGVFRRRGRVKLAHTRICNTMQCYGNTRLLAVSTYYM